MESAPYKSLVVLFCLSLLAPNIWAIVSGHEDWPYTPAPMFAHYIDETMPRYSFAFIATLEDGSNKELGYYSVGANWSLMRFFFKYVYGSVEEGSVFEEFPNDTKAAFEARLTKFFTAFLSEYKKRNKQVSVDKLTLKVRRLKPNSKQPEEEREVGVFSQGHFSHSYGES